MVKTKKPEAPATEVANQQETTENVKDITTAPPPPPKENSEENVVYVFNSRKTEHIPTLSPECLAIETLLRFKKINYKYATNDKNVDKIHGEPIILLNQKEYVGFDKIEDALQTVVAQQAEPVIFPELVADQEADCQAYVYALVDTVLYQLLHHSRNKHTSSNAAEDIIKRVKSGFQRLFKATKEDDRLTKLKPEQLAEVLKDGIKAVANYLQRGGIDKTYFFGDKPTKHDAILFGNLAQFLYEPPTLNGGSTTDFSLKGILAEDNKLVTYLEKIKETYWPDWSDRCSKPPPPTATPSKRGTFRKSKSEQQHVVSAAATTPAAVNATQPTTPPENGVNGIEKVTTNGTSNENGESKEAEKKEYENGDEIKKIDDNIISPLPELKAE
uniref:Metaxin glutathione S-transferase domain-containing protein n=1 Tax=Romanomermis culicivorax TaxID=13658 RepID=A0A915KCF4_ROMCU